MSKLSFRARQLDANKALPVYRAGELQDLKDCRTINRAVPQMPTGMEKEEESEHHLQRAISGQQVYGDTQQLVIPTPESEEVDGRSLDTLYCDGFKQPKQYIHVQAFSFDEDLPDYDIDSDDEEWLGAFNSKKELLTRDRFEKLFDQMEKNSGNQCMSYAEAKSLLGESEEVIKPVYEYWLSKRAKLNDTSCSLTPQIKGEKRDGSSTSDPYVAFRRRTEKMQTRKNRKNDESSYEKMLKLRRDLNRACTIMDMVKRREKSKKELLELTIAVFEKRYAFGDYTGQMLQQCNDMVRYQPSASNLTVPTSASFGSNKTPGPNMEDHRDPDWHRRMSMEDRVKVKNDYEAITKRPKVHHPPKIPLIVPGSDHAVAFSDDEGEVVRASSPPVDVLSEPEDDEDDADGRFAFKRRKGVRYLAPRFDSPTPLPWVSPSEGGLGSKKFRYNCLSISSPRRLVGFARRRIGRGGRVHLDRGYSPLSENLDELETLLNSSSSFALPNGLFPYDHLTGWKKPSLSHFRPKSPPTRQPCFPPTEAPAASEPSAPVPTTSSGGPRPRTHRSFSTQARSKFSLNPPHPTNGMVGQNFSRTNSSQSSALTPRNSLCNGLVTIPTATTSKAVAYSTAPMKSVYALNFPLNSSTSSQLLSNCLVRGNAPFSPTATMLTTAPGSDGNSENTTLARSGELPNGPPDISRRPNTFELSSTPEGHKSVT